MSFHFCMDEVLMIMAMIPFIGVAFRRVHAWWHVKFNHKCHDKHEKLDPFSRDPRINQISEEDAKYLSLTPAPLKITIPIKIEDDHEDH